MKLISYLADRLRERSTWTAIGASVMGAVALPMPFPWIMIAVGVIGTLVPSPTPKPGACPPNEGH